MIVAGPAEEEVLGGGGGLQLPSHFFENYI